MRRIVILFGVVTLIVACQQPSPVENPAVIQLEVLWTGADQCARRSPAFKLSNVPAETKTLEFHMRNVDVPGQDHGGGTVFYAGHPEIPAAAFEYQGPCPPRGHSHRFEWTVDALNESGELILGSGKVTTSFPPGLS